MGHNQANVRDLYLRVIQNTIDGSKAVFEDEDGENEQLTGTLERLSENWRTRLLENHDFTDDPTAIVRGSAARGASAAAKKARAEEKAAAQAEKVAKAAQATAGAAPQAQALPGIASLPGGPSTGVALPGQPDALGGQIPLPAHLGGTGSLAVPVVADEAVAAVPAPTVAKAEPTPEVGPAQAAASSSAAASAADANGASRPSPAAEPPAKRARRAAEDEVVNDNEDLDSEDSDDDNGSNADDEGNAENYILAQNDRYVSLLASPWSRQVFPSSSRGATFSL